MRAVCYAVVGLINSPDYYRYNIRRASAPRGCIVLRTAAYITFADDIVVPLNFDEFGLRDPSDGYDFSLFRYADRGLASFLSPRCIE